MTAAQVGQSFEAGLITKSVIGWRHHGDVNIQDFEHNWLMIHFSVTEVPADALRYYHRQP